MPKSENKVQFNLKNVHYAMLKDGETPAWDAPVRVPGAVSLTLDPQGEISPFYADGIIYYHSVANNGYSGALEMARFPDQMLKDVWGVAENEADHVMVENTKNEPKPFALLYQIEGDKDNQYYCMFNCMATRPGIGGSTNTESKAPQTKSSTVTASPLENGDVFARTTAGTSDEVRANWFKQVYQLATEQQQSATEPSAEG